MDGAATPKPACYMPGWYTNGALENPFDFLHLSWRCITTFTLNCHTSPLWISLKSRELAGFLALDVTSWVFWWFLHYFFKNLASSRFGHIPKLPSCPGWCHRAEGNGRWLLRDLTTPFQRDTYRISIEKNCWLQVCKWEKDVERMATKYILDEWYIVILLRKRPLLIISNSQCASGGMIALLMERKQRLQRSKSLLAKLGRKGNWMWGIKMVL